MCALLMTGLSLFIIILSLPVSLVFVVKVVQVKMFIEVLKYFYYITLQTLKYLSSKTDTFTFLAQYCDTMASLENSLQGH